jgi:tagaturonate reductase
MSHLDTEPLVTPERIIQIGTGRFLRGFVESFIDDEERVRAEAGRAPARRVTVVETTGSGTARRLAAQDHAYELRTRGLAHGRVVDTRRVIRVIDRSIDASDELDTLVDAAMDPHVKAIVSNTTEAGYAPGGYPRVLARMLASRAREGLTGVAILPCELIDRNGERLRDLVTDEAGTLGYGTTEVSHIRDANSWTTTLVDRIVTTSPSSPTDPTDAFGVVVEPFASWVIQASPDVPLMEHPSMTRTDSVEPFALRKIRILNGAHTALVAKTRGSDLDLVREAVEDPDISGWLEGLLLEEIVPALGDRISDGESFMASVLERFRNPFLDHRLVDIAVNHEQKVRLRLEPTYHEYVRRFGRPPRRLEALLMAEGMV